MLAWPGNAVARPPMYVWHGACVSQQNLISGARTGEVAPFVKRLALMMCGMIAGVLFAGCGNRRIACPPQTAPTENQFIRKSNEVRSK